MRFVGLRVRSPGMPAFGFRAAGGERPELQEARTYLTQNERIPLGAFLIRATPLVSGCLTLRWYGDTHVYTVPFHSGLEVKFPAYYRQCHAA